MAPTLASIVTEFIVEEILYGDGDLEPDEDLFDAGVLDSMTFLRMIDFLEQRFGVITDMEPVINAQSLRRVGSRLEGWIPGAAGAQTCKECGVASLPPRQNTA